jgi:hypothetical protein
VSGIESFTTFSGGFWRRIGGVLLVLAVFVFGGGDFVQAQQLLAPKELKEAARAVLKSEKSSVVWVTAKVRLRRDDDGSAVPGEAGGLAVLGTVVGKSGLTVVSNTDFDPARTLRELREEASPEFSFIEIVLESGTSVPASVVYRDAELDLAFLKPDERIAEQRGASFRPVDTSSGHSLEVMDDVIHLSRLNETMEWAPSVVLGNVSAVVRGSRTYYLSSADAEAGTPVFTADGSLLGIEVYRILEGRSMDLVTLSSETVHVISEIAEATGFLAERSDEVGTSLTEGLTLSLSDLKGAMTPVAEGAVAPKKNPPIEVGVNASMPLPTPGGASASVRPPKPPLIQQDPAPTTVPVAEVKPEPEPEPVKVAAPAPKPEPAPKPKPKPKPVSKPAPKPEPEKVAVRTASQRPPVPVVPVAKVTPEEGEVEEVVEEKKKGFRWPFGGLKLQSTAQKKAAKKAAKTAKTAEEAEPEENTIERDE